MAALPVGVGCKGVAAAGEPSVDTVARLGGGFLADEADAAAVAGHARAAAPSGAGRTARCSSGSQCAYGSGIGRFIVAERWRSRLLANFVAPKRGHGEGVC